MIYHLRACWVCWPGPPAGPGAIERPSGQWLLNSYVSLIIAASGQVSAGRLAPLDAPGRVLDLFLHGVGTHPDQTGGSHE
jgi:hypothetical protein